ncbi:MAG: hypothetical protein K0Q73_6212 [Paenibacillus sp.]|nr:hypothetical protein [Paenibacillus sp.]
MNIILNEPEAVVIALKEGQFDKKPTNTIKLLIKYYYSTGLNKSEVRDSIEQFMIHNYPRFNSVKWASLLDKLVKKEEKESHLLIEIKQVSIMKSELITIRSLINNELEKLAFVYLVYGKIFNQMNNSQSNWVNVSRKEIFQDSKVTTTAHNQRLLVNDLIGFGFIEASRKKTSGNKKVCFLDPEGELELVISDFRDYVYAYSQWKGERIGVCSSCSKLMKQNIHNQKFCQTCRKERDKELWRTNKQKLRTVQGQ